jgi:hypothetical protein
VQGRIATFVYCSLHQYRVLRTVHCSVSAISESTSRAEIPVVSQVETTRGYERYHRILLTVSGEYHACAAEMPLHPLLSCSPFSLLHPGKRPASLVTFKYKRHTTFVDDTATRVHTYRLGGTSLPTISGSYTNVKPKNLKIVLEKLGRYVVDPAKFTTEDALRMNKRKNLSDRRFHVRLNRFR